MADRLDPPNHTAPHVAPHIAAFKHRLSRWLLSRWSLCLVCGLLASNAELHAEEDASEEAQTATTIQRVTPREMNNRHSAIAEHLTLYQRQQELVLLATGDTSFYGLFLLEQAGKPQGGALILHARGQHGLWPRSAGHLREALPKIGWSTLAIELPDPPDVPLPPTSVYAQPATTDQAAPDKTAKDNQQPTGGTENTAQADSEQPEQTAADAANQQTPAEATPPAAADNSAADPAAVAGDDMSKEPPLPESTAPAAAENPSVPAEKAEHSARVTAYEQASEAYRELMIARINEGVAYLKSKGQLNMVIIAYGNSASWAAQWVAANSRFNDRGEVEKGLAMVMVNATEDPSAKVPMNQHMAKLAVPVFDLVTDNPGVSNYEIQQRAGLMRHKNRSGYQQFLLDGPITSNESDEAIVRRIRGWLRSNAAGIRLIRR